MLGKALSLLREQQRNAQRRLTQVSRAIATLEQIENGGPNGRGSVHKTRPKGGRKPYVHWTQRLTKYERAAWRAKISAGQQKRWNKARREQDYAVSEPDTAA